MGFLEAKGYYHSSKFFRYFNKELKTGTIRTKGIGLIQILSCYRYYPGHNILTEDLGK